MAHWSECILAKDFPPGVINCILNVVIILDSIAISTDDECNRRVSLLVGLRKKISGG